MFYEAGIVNFLRTLVIIIGVFYLFRLIVRWITPWLMRKTAERMKKNMHQRARQQQRQNDHRNDGDVTIEYSRDKDHKRHDNHQVGEYVDFEEVDK